MHLAQERMSVLRADVLRDRLDEFVEIARRNCVIIDATWPSVNVALRFGYSRSPRPSTHSIAMYASVSSSPYS